MYSITISIWYCHIIIWKTLNPSIKQLKHVNPSGKLTSIEEFISFGVLTNNNWYWWLVNEYNDFKSLLLILIIIIYNIYNNTKEVLIWILVIWVMKN